MKMPIPSPFSYAEVGLSNRSNRVVFQATPVRAILFCEIYPFMRYSTTVVGKDGSKSTHVLSRGVFTELANELIKCGNGKSFYDEDLRKR